MAGLSRLLFARATPINWDSVQFTLALDRFDLHLHQPHPPGYILYVALGHLFRLFVGDPSLALSLLSVACSAVAAWLLYTLTLRVFEGPGVAAGAALLLVASPLALYYGSVGLSYTPELALSLAVARVAWEVRLHAEWKSAIALGVLLGLAGGIRQTSLLVLAPLCLWALWRAGRGAWMAASLAVLVTCIAWLVPLLLVSGGLSSYLHESALQADSISGSSPLGGGGLAALLDNLAIEGYALLVGVALGLLPLALWLARLVPIRLSGAARGFLAWWALPAVAIYALGHIGQYGYLLAVLPPLLMLAAVGAWGLVVRSRPQLRQTQLAALLACGLLSLGSAALFSAGNGPVSAQAIEGNDTRWHAIEETLARMDAPSTVLVMGTDWTGPFRHAGYLLPSFHAYSLGDGQTGSFGWLYSAYGGVSSYSLPRPVATRSLTLPPGTRTVVALDDVAGRMLRSGTGAQPVSLPGGATLYLLHSEGAGIHGLVIEGRQILVTR